jgi:short-subunit dehydrogenase
MLNFRRRSWQLARCLVTGASSGLGEALAEQLVKAGARVVLTGRSAKRLQAIADRLIDEGSDPSRIVTIAADLTVEEDCQRLFDEIAGHFEGLDLVINSAGVGADGQFETHDPAVIRQVFEINVFALAEVCRRALPLLSQGIEPAMVNIGSIVARRGLPGRVEYSASKFAVSGFTEALRVEWRRFGIHVLQVNPGFTDTPFDQHIVASTARYSVARHRRMSPDAVARATLRGVERRKREITLSWQGRLLVLVSTIAPRFVDWGFTRWLLSYFPDAPVLRRDHALIAGPNEARGPE